MLVRAARAAGVRRVVQLSVTNASRGPRSRTSAARRRSKRRSHVRALVRDRPADAGLRPARHPRQQHRVGSPAHPVFPIAGDGSYRVQPVSVEDTATICVEPAPPRTIVVDAAGPETMPYEELVRLVAAAVGSRRGSCMRRRGSCSRSRASTGASARRPPDRRGARGPAGEPARLRSAAARPRELPLVGRSERRGRSAGATSPSSPATSVRTIRSRVARSELTVDLGAIRRNAREAPRRARRGGALGGGQGGRLRPRRGRTSAARRSARGRRRSASRPCRKALALRRALGPARILVLGPASSREIADAREAGLELVVVDGEIPEGVPRPPEARHRHGPVGARGAAARRAGRSSG